MTNREATQLKIKYLEDMLAKLEQKRDSIDEAMLYYEGMECAELCELEEKYIRLDNKIDSLTIELTKFKNLTVI